ncbi:uncharacterized protein CTHT_0044940 [Thermochaetoides thermophila DSM 1495]|uniref:Major facilitator superfamily (MFS) profile domain-containing protein n=1 Tax=Chaetomium thermophilum (strain DSM 1495 / CBS 144.50 / IMI 039719) TaxID=759272 RepID=G0S986_CHATD|nr:hypothetical protein CTHT_0044940 [Thermochaetoides thermophila DSM 1495]EGS19997.1 hypothetical protein CTHT_0044940 [Thermochaetoides thermophila DSM 1495]
MAASQHSTPRLGSSSSSVYRPSDGDSSPVYSLGSIGITVPSSPVFRPFDAGTDGDSEIIELQTVPLQDPTPAPLNTEPDIGRDGAASIRDESPSPPYAMGFKLFAMLASITTAIFLMMLDTSIISTAVPRITDEFHSVDDVGWYASIYSLASSAFQPITGRIYSKFNIKYSFLAFFAIFEAGSLICGTSISSGMFIIGRAVAGAGSSGFINGAVTILAATVPLEKRPSLTGIMMGFSQLGIVLGPLVGGAFTSYTTWRWCFYVNLPVGAIVAIGLMLVDIPDLVTKPKPFDVLRRLHVELDLVGFTLIAPAAVMLLLATQWGGDPYAWNSPTIIGLFCGAGASAVVWFVWNFYHGEDALIPMSILRINATWSSACTQGFLLTGVYCASFYLPMYFQAVKGVVPMMSGVYLIASIGSQLLSAVVAGMLVERTGYVIPYAMLSGIIGSVSNGLYSTFKPDTATSKWVGYQVLNGVGRGFGMQMPVLAVQAALRPPQIPIGLSVVSFIQSLCVAIALAVSGTIFDLTLVHDLTQRAPDVDPNSILDAGATNFRSIVAPKDLPVVLQSYNIAISHVFYMAAGITGLAVFTSLFMGWIDIRKTHGSLSANGPRTGDAAGGNGQQAQQQHVDGPKHDA